MLNASHQLYDSRSINCMAWLAALIDVLSVTNFHHRHDQKLICNFINDSVYTLSDPVALLP